MSRTICKEGGKLSLWLGASEAAALATTIERGATVADRGALTSANLRARELHRAIAGVIRFLADNGGGILAVEGRDAE